MLTININLCSHLQSFGYKDYFEIKKTKLEPTKSAVAGIIACCAGIPRNDKRIKEIEKSFTMKIEKLEIPKAIGDKRKKELYIKTLMDYQIARGTEENPIWQADGKEKKTNLVIKKDYIEDTYFRVKISGEDDVIKKYAEWLYDPVWVPYIGRKCCTPSIPIFLKEENPGILEELCI